MADGSVVLEGKQSFQVFDARFPLSRLTDGVPVVETDENEGCAEQNKDERSRRSEIAAQKRCHPMWDHNIDSSRKSGIGICPLEHQEKRSKSRACSRFESGRAEYELTLEANEFHLPRCHGIRHE
jgi:hypothetical protein